MTQASLFDDGSVPPAPEVLKVTSEAEVRELARDFFDLPKPPPEEPPLLATRRRLRAEVEGASRRGLVARWSRAFGFLEIHDPTEGEWHDLPWKEAPAWARWEARKRKDLDKSGYRRAFDLPASEIWEIWEAENLAAKDEGIVEDHPVDGEA